MSLQLKQAVSKQRKILKSVLGDELKKLSDALVPNIENREVMEETITEALHRLEHCKYIYVLDREGKQITANISHDGKDESQLTRDRSLRPYMAGMFGSTNFRLSQAYISRRKRRPSLTAIQKIRDNEGTRVGFLGVDYDLRELPHTEGMVAEDRQWQQIKGDPSIRANLFMQSRVQSMMDDHLDDVFALMEELMCEHGVYHGKLHFASSRATVWHADDPFDYHILSIEELIDPDICLAFPRRPYLERAVVDRSEIRQVLTQFSSLRFADETIYLRAGSLNLVNGMVGLNFSCDGSHYLPFDEFLGKGLDFWFGTGTTCEVT